MSFTTARTSEEFIAVALFFLSSLSALTSLNSKKPLNLLSMAVCASGIMATPSILLSGLFWAIALISLVLYLTLHLFGLIHVAHKITVSESPYGCPLKRQKETKYD